MITDSLSAIRGDPHPTVHLQVPGYYSQLDRPTVQRQRAVGDGLRHDVDSEEMLDITAFLRRQAGFSSSGLSPP